MSVLPGPVPQGLLPDLGPSRLLVPSAPATLSCVGLIPGPGKTFLQTQKSEFCTSFHMSGDIPLALIFPSNHCQM